MLSHRQSAVNGDGTSPSYADGGGGTDTDEEGYGPPPTGAVAVSVAPSSADRDARRRPGPTFSSSSSSSHYVPAGQSINAAYSSLHMSDRRMPYTREHKCCCLTLRTPPTRRLHLAFLKALGWTCMALALVFLLGVIIEPLFLEPDGWVDCADAACNKVVQPSRLVPLVPLPLPTVDPAHSLLGSALRKTDLPEEHPIANPAFFHEWHERTVTDFLDRRKEVAQAIEGAEAGGDASATKATTEGGAGMNQGTEDTLDALTRPSPDSGAGERPSPLLARQLYVQGDGSIHTDLRRSRELLDGEKAQLEKAYLGLVPWLPHHMRLGLASAPTDPHAAHAAHDGGVGGGGADGSTPSAPAVPKSKTTMPLLTRASLDATTAYLTDNCPGCMWVRVWVVNSALYVHSFNTKRESEFVTAPPGTTPGGAAAAGGGGAAASGAVASSSSSSSGSELSPTNVFGYESSRLNHFLMMLLHVLSLSLSGRLAPDASFHHLPAQPSVAAGGEDGFPALDAVFSLGDQPCGNVSAQIEFLEGWRAQLSGAVKEKRAKDAAAAKADKDAISPAAAAAGTKDASPSPRSPVSATSLLSIEEEVVASSVAAIRARTKTSSKAKAQAKAVAEVEAAAASHAAASTDDAAAAVAAAVAAPPAAAAAVDPTPSPSTPPGDPVPPATPEAALPSTAALVAAADPAPSPGTTPSGGPVTMREEQPSLFDSILSFQSGFGDENTRALLLLPRTLEAEVTERERTASRLRRGLYPKPPLEFAPLFGIRQPAAASLPPPPGSAGLLGPQAGALAAAAGPGGSFALAGALFAGRQLMHHSPTMLLPDFTRWNELVVMEEESISAGAGLRAPGPVRTARHADHEEGEVEEEHPEEEHASPADDSNPAASAAAAAASEPLPALAALKLHQLHNKQIAHLRSTKKIMIVLSALPALSSEQIQSQNDELEVAGLAKMNVRDVHNMGDSVSTTKGKGGKSGGGGGRKGASLQQRMLSKMHVLLKHRLVHIHDYPLRLSNGTLLPPQDQASRARAKSEGEAVLDAVMELLNQAYGDYNPLEEQRRFQAEHETGFKIYDGDSVVPPSCHLPFVVYEESAANVPRPASRGAGAAAAAAAGGGINPLPGSWAHWLWTCDYLVLREVNAVPQVAPPPSPPTTAAETEGAAASTDPSGTATSKKKKKKKKVKKTSSKPPTLPPLILPASNSFDEYWSVTYEAYKHYIPFVLRMEPLSPEGEAAVAAEVETKLRGKKEAEEAAAAAAASSPDGRASRGRRQDHHTLLTQLRASHRLRLLQATVPQAYSSSGLVLHLLPLLHEVRGADWTRLLAPGMHGAPHRHEVRNADARRKGLMEEGSEHEDAAKELLGVAPADEADAEAEADPEPSLSPLRSYAERHSCSSHFSNLSDSLSCLWCVRASSRHWMRSVMSPEFIASYARKLFTLYAHALAAPPTKADLDAAPVPLVRLKTHTDVREFIKHLVFSNKNTDD